MQIDGNLDEALRMFYKKIYDSSAGLTEEDQKAINIKGAQVFEKAEREITNEKHRSNHHDEKFGHAADNVGITGVGSTGNYNGKIKVGSYIVGWKNKYHAMNMMRVNDGTSTIVGDHFITNLRKDSTVRQRMLEAEKAEYDRIIKRKREAGDRDDRG